MSENNGRIQIAQPVNMGALWSFFLESGFIYPQKLVALQSKLDEVKETLARIYNGVGREEVARHFIYQNDAQILGHMAMLRLYDSAWLIHHHAAKGSFRAGLGVLEEVSRFVTESHCNPDLHMKYVTCFYRPENAFPKRVFNGVCTRINDRSRCTEESFAYLHLHGANESCANSWDLSTSADLVELESFCRQRSGSPLSNALCIGENEGSRELTRAFARIGLKRERLFYSLRTGSGLKAIAMVNLSSAGLNLSDLTNSITLFVLNEEGFENTRRSLSTLMELLGQQEIPILVYPEASAKVLGLQYERSYVMWCLDLRYANDYNVALTEILRGTKRKS